MTEKSDETFEFAEVGKAAANLEGTVLDQSDVYILDTGTYFAAPISLQGSPMDIREGRGKR